MRLLFINTSAILLLVLPSIFLSLHLRDSTAPESQHIKRFVNDLAELNNTLPPLKDQIAQLEADTEFHRISNTRIQWTKILRYLDTTTNSRIRVSSFRSSINTTNPVHTIELELNIQTDTLLRAREFLVTLESSALFDTIEMLESRRQITQDEAVVISTIRAQIIPQP